MAIIKLKSRGQFELLDKTTRKRGVAAELARRCSSDPAVVSNWCRKGSKPETPSRIQIRNFLGIDLEAYEDDPPQEFWDEEAEAALRAEETGDSAA